MLIKSILRIKPILVTLRFSILLVFIALFLIALFIILSFVYFSFADTTSKISFAFMRQLASPIFTQFANEVKNIQFQGQLTDGLIQSHIINPDDQQELDHYLVRLLKVEKKRTPSTQAILWGDKLGSFVMVRKEENGGITSILINRLSKPPMEKIIYRDAEDRVIRRLNSHVIHYDPRTRPWYISAIRRKEFIRTDIYTDQMTGTLGMTSAVPILQHDHLAGIFAIDTRLDYLKHFIENLKASVNGVVFIVTQSGKLVAFPGISQYRHAALMNIEALPIPWIRYSFDQYQRTKQEAFTFHYHHQHYLAVYQLFPFMQDDQWLIGIVSPEKDFIARIQRDELIVIFSIFMTLIVGIFLMSSLVTRIVNPIKLLVYETRKIKQFNLKDVICIPSRIKEIRLLTDSIDSMKQGLRAFQKYVPATLVRQLIQSGQDAFIGGEKKLLAIFFSDIANFTTKAESMDPNQLVQYICDYFNELSQIIGHTGGTIDKYIGDSLMAFWGAPLLEDQPCEKAAYAALQCLQRISDLNTLWTSQNKPLFQTRIGLHFGEAIVGNIGSDERLNYTAIGDAINVASRLEGLNKVYHTSIITSEEIYQQIKDLFVLRKLDCVSVKGRSNNANIYELLAEHPAQLGFDIAHYREIFELGFEAYQHQQWEQAIHYFEVCMTIDIEDTLALVFIERCKQFFVSPPPADWSGIWHFHEK